MSSSSRSSLGSTPSRKNPSWRSSSLSKNSSPARLSYVVAEPEQGSPLASATSKLPSQLASARGAEDVIELDITNNSWGHTETLQDAYSVTSVNSAPDSESSRGASESRVNYSTIDIMSGRTTRDTHPSRMVFKELTVRRGSSALNGWLASATRLKGKEKVISQPVPVATGPPLAAANSKPLDTSNVSSPVASSSKPRIGPEPQGITSFPASADIPPLPSVPSTCVCQTPSKADGAQSRSDVPRPLSTPGRINDTSRPLTSDALSVSTCLGPAPNTEHCPGPGSIDKKQIPIDGNSSPKLDTATNISDETSSKHADPAANRSWFGTWFEWSSSTPAHGTSATVSNSDIHRTDHDRQSPRHETEFIKPNPTLQAHITDPHISNTSNTVSSEAHDDKYQLGSQDNNQVSEQASELAVAPNGEAPTSSAPSDNAPNLTTDSDATTKPIDPGSPGKDAVQSTSQVSSLPKMESRTSLWDYIGWRSNPAASPSSNTCVKEPRIPVPNTVNVNGETGKDSNTGLGVGKLDGIADNSQVKALSQPLSCDVPAVEIGGKDASGKTTSSGKALVLVLSPLSSGTSSSTEMASVPDSGSETTEDQQPLILPCSSERERGSDREGGKQDPGQDQAHAGRADGGTDGAWYIPWTWYGYSSGSSAVKGSSADPGEGDTALVVDQSKNWNKDREVGDSSVMTIDNKQFVRLENGHEEQREGQVPAQASPVSPSLTGTIEINPIAATIDTHRSSWLSFFASRTSRTLVTKSITGPPDSNASADARAGAVKVDENGVEVMDIEDDGAPLASPSPKEQVDASKAKEGKESDSDVIPPSQGLVATLVKGRSKVRDQPRSTEQQNVKDGNSDASSIRSVAQKSGTATPVVENGGGTSLKVDQDGVTTTAGSLPSSTATLAKRVSLTPAMPTTKPVDVTNNKKSKSVSPTPSPKKLIASPPPPNLILPTWQYTFHTAPRNVVASPEAGVLAKTMQYVSGILFSGGSIRFGSSSVGGKGLGEKGKWVASNAEKERKHVFADFGKALPRAWDVMNATHADGQLEDVLRGCKRVVVIGVHGWFPGAVMRTVIGEPTGTSSKFANMMVQALEEFQDEHGVKLEKVTKIPLEGEGTIKRRVEKLYSSLLANQDWINDIHTADAILVATHSQGSIVSTHLLDRLIGDKHIRTSRNSVVVGPAGSFPTAAGMDTAPLPRTQKICCLAMCGIHLGPLRYLNTTSLFQPYFQYLESPAARELFEFQNTDSEVSKEYVNALRNVLYNGVKTVYVASLNDQVVPIYSGVFTAASHPLILRALYIDGDAYHSSDFLANILVLLLRILNSGISDSGLLAHLSEATAGSLNGVGHSTAYEDVATYALAVKYLFLTNDGLEEHPDLLLEPFNARQEQNDYEIPWALRDVIADERVAHFFPKEIVQLRDAFREWHPRTSILRDLKRKLQPIQRLPGSFSRTRL